MAKGIPSTSETDIIDIIENYDPFKIPEPKAIIESGMEGLLNWAKKKGVNQNYGRIVRVLF